MTLCKRQAAIEAAVKAIRKLHVADEVQTRPEHDPRLIALKHLYTAQLEQTKLFEMQEFSANNAKLRAMSALNLIRAEIEFLEGELGIEPEEEFPEESA